MNNEILELLKEIEDKLDRINEKLDKIDEKTECISNNLKSFNSKEQLNSINEINAKVDYINKFEIKRIN